MPPWCEYVSSFSQSRELEALPKSLESSGRMLFSCNKGLIWQTSEPVSEAVIYTQSGSNFKVDNDQQISELNDLVHSNMSSLLLAMMAGDLAALEQRFAIENEDGRITLTPKDDNTARFLKSITITGSDDGATVQLHDASQQITTLKMSAATEIHSLDRVSCQKAMATGGPACDALLFPDQVAAGLTSDR